MGLVEVEGVSIAERNVSDGRVHPVWVWCDLSVCTCSVAYLCPTLCDPMDCSPPGSSVRRISQARILEWVAISFSRGSSQHRD